MPRTTEWKWLTACVVASLCFTVIPFAWRSTMSTWVILAGCLFPIWGVLAVVFAAKWLIRNRVAATAMVTGVLIVLAGVVFGFSGDKVARAAIFRLNYGNYRAGAASLMRDVRRHPISVSGYGVEHCQVVEQDGQWALKIETASGPTLETVVYSPTPLASLKPYTLRLVRRDDLGHWYFADL